MNSRAMRVVRSVRLHVVRQHAHGGRKNLAGIGGAAGQGARDEVDAETLAEQSAPHFVHVPHPDTHQQVDALHGTDQRARAVAQEYTDAQGGVGIRTERS
jgi:hypothetical protein